MIEHRESVPNLPKLRKSMPNSGKGLRPRYADRVANTAAPSVRSRCRLLARPFTPVIDDEVVDAKMVASCQGRHWPHAHDAALELLEVEVVA